MSLNTLVVRLSIRYNQLGVMEDLNEAIVLDREALNLCTPGHPLRFDSFNNLAVDLSSRYKQLRAIEDLDEAIILARDGLALRPPGRPDRSQSLDSLARFLRTRFTWSSRLNDREELFSLYAQLVDVTQMVSSTDLSATRAWVRVAEDFNHPTTPLAYETSLRLFIQHLATLPSLPQHLTVLKNLISSLSVDAFLLVRSSFSNKARGVRSLIPPIIRCDLENPRFAYLAACHTTVGDEESPNEEIHLASAMQFAGFRSVIGTMWAMDDGETNEKHVDVL